MMYYSTNGRAPQATLREAVERGLAPDRGLYMPDHIQQLPASFFDRIDQLTFQEMSFEVARAFFGSDVDDASLKRIVTDTLAFETPLQRVEEGI